MKVLFLSTYRMACLHGACSNAQELTRGKSAAQSCAPQVRSLSIFWHKKSTQPPESSHRPEESIPQLQPSPILFHRPSANNFLPMNFGKEVRKTNYFVLSDQRRVLKGSAETGSCCSPSLQSWVWKIGHWSYGQDTLRVPGRKRDFFPSFFPSQVFGFFT